MPSAETRAAQKERTRTELTERRRSYAQAQLEAFAEQLATVVLDVPEVQDADTVGCYVGVDEEPGTLALLDALKEAGKTVLVPITNPDMTLDWAEYTGPDDLAEARFGLLEPVTSRLGTAAIKAANVVLLPATAVDATGVRLGRGGGCYDRVLAMLPDSVVTCALLYPDEVLDELPTEPHDKKVQLAATPAGVVRFD
ncbi:MAG: 5-formyltetrahydrofolate cyclo-ligase [Streptosporangiales bacterium]|nr:5-formyltetrahydrofolate cyclo-ligase [Streptosporangiales bacterium]